MKYIIHMDIDAFFPSAAQAIDPSIQGKPVVVSKKKTRGVVLSASYEARKLGIHAGMPNFLAEKIEPNLIYVWPDFSLYANLSSKVFDIVSKMSKEMEVASIDECYLKANDNVNSIEKIKEFCEKLRNEIKLKVNINVSFGIGKNRFTAKMATDINKPQGISFLFTDEQIKNILWEMPIKKYFGIGRQTEPKLIELGIKKIGDLTRWNRDELKEILGIRTDEIITQALGKGDSTVYIQSNDLKSIGNCETFINSNLQDENMILEVLKKLTRSTCQRINDRNLVAFVISINIKDKDFKMHSRQRKLSRPIWKFDDIWKVARELFFELWNYNEIRLVGINTSQLHNRFDSLYQQSIFDKDEYKSKVDQIIARVNNKFRSNITYKGSDFERQDTKKKSQNKYFDPKVHNQVTEN